MDVAYRPSVEDVAGELRARTKADGEELGVFTDATRPTAAQVEEAIDRALERLPVAKVTDACADRAKAWVALQAAAIVERSYQPEQATLADSTYRLLIAELADVGEGLVACVEGSLPGAEGGGMRVIDLTVYPTPSELAKDDPAVFGCEACG